MLSLFSQDEKHSKLEDKDMEIDWNRYMVTNPNSSSKNPFFVIYRNIKLEENNENRCLQICEI